MNVPGVHLVRADSGLENVVYLIVLTIWGIAQVIRKNRKTGPSAPPPAQATQPIPQTAMPDHLREMLESLTGQKFEPVRPRPPPPPAPVDTRNRRAVIPRGRAATIPPPAPRRQPQAAITRAEPEPAYKLPELSKQIPLAVASALTLKGMTGSLRSVRMATASMGGGMPMAPRPGHIGSPILDLRDRALLRNAMIGRIILGPPKALEHSPRPEM